MVRGRRRANQAFVNGECHRRATLPTAVLMGTVSPLPPSFFYFIAKVEFLVKTTEVSLDPPPSHPPRYWWWDQGYEVGQTVRVASYDPSAYSLTNVIPTSIWFTAVTFTGVGPQGWVMKSGRATETIKLT